MSDRIGRNPTKSPPYVCDIFILALDQDRAEALKDGGLASRARAREWVKDRSARRRNHAT
jgi:hypothetical protein